MTRQAEPLAGVPLHNIEIEQGLLGALLLRNSNFDVLAGKLQAEHFFEPLHQTIFSEIARKVGLGEAATPLTVRGSLPVDFTVAGMSASQYLARLAAEATVAMNVPAFADNVMQYKAAREHVFNAREMIDGCLGGTPVDEALKVFHDNAEAVRNGYLGPGVRDTSAILDDVMESAVERMGAVLRNEPLAGGLATGLEDLDVALGGLQRANLVIIAARPSMGKSSLMVSVSRQMALSGYGVGVMSLEMDKVSIGARYAADHAFDPRYIIAYNSMFNGQIGKLGAETIANAAADLRGRRPGIEFDFANGMTVAQLTGSVRRMASKLALRKQTLDVLFIDYLKFVKASDRYFGKRNEEVAETIAALRSLARMLNCCIVLFHQLNREVEKVGDKRPSLEHLRESGAAEEDADVVILLFRQAYYIERSGRLTDPDQGKADAARAELDRCKFDLELIVAKQRMGPVQDVKVYCDVSTSTVRSPAPEIFRGPPIEAFR